MEVWAGGIAGRPRIADHIAGLDAVARRDRNIALVAIPNLGAVIERDNRAVPVSAGKLGRLNGAAGHRDDRRPRRSGKVQSRVGAGPQTAAFAEAGRQMVSGPRYHPLVGFELAGPLLALGGRVGQGRRNLLGRGWPAL